MSLTIQKQKTGAAHLLELSLYIVYKFVESSISLLEIGHFPLVDPANNKVLLLQKQHKAEPRLKRRKTLPQLFQVSIPDMMILFHFLSELIVFLSELLTKSLEKHKATLSQTLSITI